MTLAVILLGVAIWFLCVIYLKLKEYFRKRTNITGAFACALAYVHNYEERDRTKHVYRGVGKNKAVINEWIDDIWEAYELGEEDHLQEREIKLLIDQTFKRVNAKIKYTDKDVGDIYNQIDVVKDGSISKPEMRLWLTKIGQDMIPGVNDHR